MKIFSDRKMAQNRHFARKNPLRSSQNAAGLKLVFQERAWGKLKMESGKLREAADHVL